MKWLAEVVRLTVFTVEAEAPHSVEWWQSVVGEPPSERLTKNSPPIVRDVGLVLNGSANLVMEYQLGRVDWHLIPNFDPSDPPDGFPNIGDVINVISYLIELFKKWLPHAPRINRLALGCGGLYPVPNRSEGYKELQKYLPAVQLDTEGSSDFSYSINRPRLSKTSGQNLIVNRLSKWSVIQMQLLQLTSGQPVPIGPLGKGETACKVELDVNSAHGFEDVLPVERLANLSEEFKGFLLEILSEGDKP